MAEKEKSTGVVSPTIEGKTETLDDLPVEAEQQDKVIVNFQVDRDTTIQAEVLGDGDREDTLDLIVSHEFMGKYKTSVSGGNSTRVLENVRKGSRFEEGTWFLLENNKE
jgi:hypothetical protein